MSKLAKATFALMVVTLLTKVSGLLREMVLMYAYGTSMYSDVYITAMNIPLVLFSAIGSALANTFIPLYHENIKVGGREKGDYFIRNVLGIVMILSIFISLIAYICAEPLVKLFAMQFEGDKLELAVGFVRIMVLGIIFISISNILTAYLQIQDEFSIPGMIALPNNIIIIISIILSIKLKNIYILPIGSFLGMVSQYLFLLPFAIKKGYRIGVNINFKDEYIRKMVVLVGPVLIGVAIYQVNTMIDRSLASSLGDGIIAALNSANRLNLFVTGLFISTLASVIYPTLSKLSNEDNKENFKEAVVKSSNVVILLVLPITIGAIVLAQPVVKAIFERGAFDERSTSLTSVALIFYSIGMIGFGLRDILNKVFFSLKDTKTPMINGLISMILNIAINLILIKYMGHAGLALATSLSAIICVVLLFKSLNDKIGYFGQDKIINVFVKSLIASIVMGIITKISYNSIYSLLGGGTLQEIIVLFSSIIIGAIIYGVVLIILNVEKFKFITNIIKDKIKK
jgi:integral membrane protein mviN